MLVTRSGRRRETAFREEIRAGDEERSCERIRDEIRGGDEETRRFMRILHEEVIERFKRLEAQP